MRREAGFTLLETLVALVLMSLLLVALFGGFRAGISSWRLADEHIAKKESQMMLVQMLQRHMSQLVDGGGLTLSVIDQVRGGGRSDGLFHHATETGLRYVAPLGQSADNELYLIELRSKAQEQGGLWIRMVPFQSVQELELLEALEAAEYTQVSAQIEARFSYFLAEEWVHELGEQEYPRLLKIEWLSEDQSWPATVFRLNGRFNERG